MKNVISVFYRHRPIRKLSVSGFIGIGRYEKTYRSYTESFWGIFLNWWRNCQKFDGPSSHPIRFKNVMAIKAIYEKLMAITDGPSLMDHHRHVWKRSIHQGTIALYTSLKNPKNCLIARKYVYINHFNQVEVLILKPHGNFFSNFNTFPIWQPLIPPRFILSKMIIWLSKIPFK